MSARGNFFKLDNLNGSKLCQSKTDIQKQRGDK